MADKKPVDAKAAPEAGADEAAPKKKKGGIKVIAIVAVLMGVEAGGLFFALKGGPAHTEASEAHVDLTEDTAQHKEEVLIVEDQFQNLQTGMVWIWDVSVYAEVKSSDSEQLQEILKRRAAAVRQGISQIFSRAQHSQLKEPEHLVLNRQIITFITKLIEEETPGAAANPDQKLVSRILIPKCRGFPAN